MISSLLKKYKSFILYGIFGGLTTVLNIGLYIVCTRVFQIGTIASNTIAWIGGVIFAYITNRIYVFESNESSIRGIFREFVSFVSCRLVTGGLDLTIMYIFVDLCHFDDLVIKIISNIIVIILNYVGSKIVVFRKKNNSKDLSF